MRSLWLVLVMYHLAGCTDFNIVQRTNELQVPFGRMLALDPQRHLNIHVDPGDRCTVRVIQSDPVTLRPGRINLSHFQCQFEPDQVHYIHYGSRTPTTDRIRLLIRYDTDQDTVVTSLTLRVRILFDQLEIVSRNIPLMVEQSLGFSNPIDRSVLQLSYDKITQECQVAVMPKSILGLPRYGSVVNETHPGMFQPCDEFLLSDIRYKHSSSTSPKRDSIPLVVQVSDKDAKDAPVKQEHFQIAVLMKEAQDNTPPQPSFSATLLMHVNQFVMTAITPFILGAEDIETDPSELIFNITKELRIGEGQIVSTDDPDGLPVTTFYQKDLEDLKIAYRPPSSDSDVRRVFEVEMVVVDEEGLTSEPFTLVIVVRPMNTLAPLATRISGLTLFEGQSRKIQSGKNLEIADEDNLEDVQISVVEGLRHGRLLLMDTPIKHLSPADLDTGAVIYQHDGSDTYTDNIIFKLDDGTHQVELLFPVSIYPVDDEPPILNVNVGLVAVEGEDTQLTPVQLSATDIDSDDDAITFHLQQEESPGLFIFKQTTPDSAFNWTHNQGMYERMVTSWTQKDLQDGRLYFRAARQKFAQSVTRRISFRLMDDHGPPNVSPEKHISIKIEPKDVTAPTLYPGTPLQMTVDENQLTIITKKHLRYTDQDTPDRKLTIKITRKPYDTDLNNPMDPGRLVNAEQTEEETAEFTQAQINHHKIAYFPPPVEMGLVPRIVHFEFDVTDASGNTSPVQEFMIFLRPVNNKPPIILNTGFEVNEGGRIEIGSHILDANDPDTDPNLILFVLTKAPQYGSVLVHGEQLAVGSAFNKSDLLDGSVSYVNSKVENRYERDDFRLEVSDGYHKVPVNVRVHILPAQVEKSPWTTLISDSEIEVNEGGRVAITEKHIRTSNNDNTIIFRLLSIPKFGVIEVAGRKKESFTQEELSQQQVFYVHNGGELGRNSATDYLNLTVSDTHSLQVVVVILPTDNTPPDVTLPKSLSVPEGGKSIISLNVSDLDTDPDDLTCTILVQPTNGYLENISPSPGSQISRQGIPITAFPLTDVLTKQINYVQSVHKGVEPSQDRFTFSCSDGINFSPKVIYPIRIDPINDELPNIRTEDFIVTEGADLIIDRSILTAEDSDIPRDNLTFTILRKPRHGTLVSLLPTGVEKVTEFSAEQITGARGAPIAYQHDDSESKEDEFELLLSDGVHQVRNTVTITIIPVDDETPRMRINEGMRVDIAEVRELTNRQLRAHDIDSDNSLLTFVIRKAPTHGYLIHVDGETGNTIQNLSLASNFTQGDIDNGRIKYIHAGHDGVRDLLKFDLTDGHNTLVNQKFSILVESLDKIYPDVINKGVELPEGGRVTLTTDILSTSDINSDDHRLRFNIKRNPLRGHLENSDHMGVPIRTFTQLDLAGNKINYVHTSPDEIKVDSFEFEVTDGRNSVFRTFSISISDVDNKRPVLFVNKLRLKEGGHKLITPFELKIEDSDTINEQLMISIMRSPMHGRILFKGFETLKGTFSMDDVLQNKISYLHDGSDTTEDAVSLTVTDGSHQEFFAHPNLMKSTKRNQVLPIEIRPVDNRVPQIVANTGSSYIIPLNSPIGQFGMRLTSHVLRATDRDTPVKYLRYQVTRPPQHGYLINGKKDKLPTVNFTQSDIDSIAMYYVIKNKENATNDFFAFKIVDPGGNELDKQEFHFKWAYVSLESDFYVVNETQEYLNVHLHRRGYLGETAFIGVLLRNKTAKEGLDFGGHYAKQVQFSPGQTEAQWKIQIFDDGIFERLEEFEIVLQEPIMVAIEHPNTATVRIKDPEDESMVFFRDSQYQVNEEIGELQIPIERMGDLSRELLVVCSTEAGTAMGSSPNSIQSFSDFIGRSEDHRSTIRFLRNQSIRHCPVWVVDDALYEDAESFTLRLTLPVGGRIGDQNVTEIVIVPDKRDEPVISFDSSNYLIEESAGYVQAKVIRSGSDLSKSSGVTVQSRPNHPLSAHAGTDYVGIGETLMFAPGETHKLIKVKILDDIGHPRMEGPESFRLQLFLPSNATLGTPDNAKVIISDNYTDLPKLQFKNSAVTVSENEGQISILVQRRGDSKHQVSVICHTQQNSAQAGEDYEERPKNEASRIVFEPGVTEKACTVNIKDDPIYEKDETLQLLLTNPRSQTAGNAELGNIKQVVITIKDQDKPVIKLEKKKIIAREPKEKDRQFIARVKIVRLGDMTNTSAIRVYTKDGSAISGKDYLPISNEYVFNQNISHVTVEIKILYDVEEEYREAFTLNIVSNENSIVDLQDTKAIIYIEDRAVIADVTFPTKPRVLSLHDYDSISDRVLEPPSGYPIVCVTPCNAKHPEFDKTGPLCTKEGIDDAQTHFRWRVAELDGDLREIESSTFLASTHHITLDSIYFSAGSLVQCISRAVTSEGEEGLESSSSPIKISTSKGFCPPGIEGLFGAEPFIAKMRYTGTEDAMYPNLIHLQVKIPHQDGLFPVISTRQPTNFEFILSRDALRIGQHLCSNIVDFKELHTTHGFLGQQLKKFETLTDTKPYQYDSQLREEKTIRFYSNLDLDACMWDFSSYFNMSELVTQCGGKITANGEVLNLVQSYVSIRVPLFISYVFRSTAARGGWRHSDLNTELRMNFVYDTAILWNKGIIASKDSLLQGNLFPMGMSIVEDGKLMVTFRTKPKFTGRFVMGQTDLPVMSQVISPNRSELTFKLELINSKYADTQQEQTWRFTSDYSVRDYSGLYQIRLVPCAVREKEEEGKCHPQEPIMFDLPIRFQQVSDPVPTAFSLNTQFHVLKKKSEWLVYAMELEVEDKDKEDTIFQPGEMVYGRISVDPVQNMGKSFQIFIEKCFLCAGVDGYIPKYRPEEREYGCISQSPQLIHIFKIIDKGSPETVIKSYQSIYFNATLAEDDKEVATKGKLSGIDGFWFSSAPLFQAAPWKQWFIHCIYTIKSDEVRSHKIAKRSIQKEIEETLDIGASHGRGTNMHQIILDYKTSVLNHQGGDHSLIGWQNSYLLPLIIAAVFCFLVIMIITVLVGRHFHRTVPSSIVIHKNDNTLVQQSKCNDSSGEKTEV